MKKRFSDDQLKTLCGLAIRAAQEAGEWIEKFDRQNLKTVFKNVGTSEASQLVTEVDIASESIIRNSLQECSKSLDIAFVGEESSLDTTDSIERFEKPYFWCVDPLDGTLPFSQGRSGYAVSISLLEQSGKPVIGVVYDPEQRVLWHAIDQQGCYRNQAAFSSTLQSLDKRNSNTLMVYADASFKTHENYDLAYEALERCAHSLGLEGANFIYGNGAVINACNVIDSSFACYLKLPKLEEGGGSIWDYAATACIAKESRAWASNSYGQALDLNRRDSTFMNHQGVLFASSAQVAQCLLGALSSSIGRSKH